VYCPTDFVTVFDVLKRYSQDEVRELKVKYEKYGHAESEFGPHPLLCVQDAIEECALKSMVTDGAIHISSPRGDVMKISAAILETAFQPIIIPEGSETSIQTSFFLHLVDKWGWPIEYDFAERGIIDLYSGKGKIERVLPLYYDRASFTITAKIAEYLENLFSRAFPDDDFCSHFDGYLFGERNFLQEIAEKFEGWSICAPNNSIPKELNLDPVFVDELMEKDSAEKQAASQFRDVTKEILEAFESGEATTKSEQFQLLSKGISWRKFEYYRRQASEINPAISMPGRRKNS
jgi:hypothetical protein